MASKKKKKISVFANFIISTSIAMLVFITVLTLIQYWVLKVPIPSDVLAVIGGAWAGELVTIAARQIFGSDIIKKKRDAESEDVL